MNNCLSYQFLNLFCIFDRISAMLNQSELKLGWGKEENMVNSADDQRRSKDNPFCALKCLYMYGIILYLYLER